MPSTTSELAIDAKELTQTYGTETALDAVSLAIPPGTVYGFLGPSGAGKTTTMRLLTRLSEPSSGSARISGVSVTDRRATASHIGYLPETPPLYDEFNAREQLDYVADLRDIPMERARTRIDNYLEDFVLADDADRRIRSYSKGMRQKTAFIQSVVHDPDVLFLDEPISGLDPRRPGISGSPSPSSLTPARPSFCRRTFFLSWRPSPTRLVYYPTDS